MPLCLFNWMSSLWNYLIKLSVNTQRSAVTFVAPSARSYLFHFILSTNKSKTSATKHWDFTFWTCLSNRLTSDFDLPKGYNESTLNSDSQFLSVICVMLESKTEEKKKKWGMVFYFQIYSHGVTSGSGAGAEWCRALLLLLLLLVLLLPPGLLCLLCSHPFFFFFFYFLLQYMGHTAIVCTGW